MIPWMMGTTSDEPHSAQAGGVDRRRCLICFRAISWFHLARRYVSLQVTPFPVEPASAGVQRHIIGRFFVVGAELTDVEGLEVVGRNEMLAFLDRLAKRERNIVRHIGSDHHRPPPRIDRRPDSLPAFEASPRHYGRTITHRR